MNSDMAGIGLISTEIARHGNYLLTGYYLPADDTFLFTELPFQLIPQVLTGYEPITRKLVSYLIFALAVAALSYVVYMVSGEAFNALLFGALASNLPPAGYSYFAIPTTHIATIVFLGAMFILLLYIGKRDKEFEEKGSKRKKRQTAPSKVYWLYVIGLGALTLFSVLSDTIILTWLILPFILAYLLLYKEKSPGMNAAVASMAIVSALAYIFKTNLVREWVAQSFVKTEAANIMSVTLPLSIRSLAIFLDTGLYRLLDGASIGILEAASIIVAAALILYALKNAVKDRERRFFYGLLLISGLVMIASFLVMSLVKDISQARYFTFTALTVFMAVGVAYRKDDRIFSGLALVFLLLSAFYGLSQAIAVWDYQPNAQDYGLIDYLKENNLTHGYGSYWVSNTLTYLSREDVTVRAVLFYRDDLRPNAWLACERWYLSPPEKAFILVDNSTLDDNGRQVIGSLARSMNSSEPLHFGKYLIYPTNRRAFRTSEVQVPQVSMPF
jgi:disulfide bond formation protein DsbB